MTYVVKKRGGGYVVKHKFTGHTKGEFTSHAKAQRRAHELNRAHERRTPATTRAGDYPEAAFS